MCFHCILKQRGLDNPIPQDLTGDDCRHSKEQDSIKVIPLADICPSQTHISTKAKDLSGNDVKLSKQML